MDQHAVCSARFVVVVVVGGGGGESSSTHEEPHDRHVHAALPSKLVMKRRTCDPW